MDYKTVLLAGSFLIGCPFSIQGYQLSCPSSPQWKTRGAALCNISSEYTCFFNTNDNEYNENCGLVSKLLGPGYKFVISGLLDRRQCGQERFQPFSLVSITSSSCVSRKSQCEGEGQTVYNNGTTTHDRSCRCNYIDNFVFVTMPKERCYCTPSQEDCSCYYKTCPEDHYLTPDDQCVHFNNWTGIFHCSEIQREKKLPSVAPTKDITIKDPKQDSTMSSTLTLGSVTTILIMAAFLCMELFILYKTCKNNRNSQGNFTHKSPILQNDIGETDNNLEIMKRLSSIKKDNFEKNKTDCKLVETRPFKLLKKHMVENDYCDVIGASGSGKTVILYQLANEMFKTEGYKIIIGNKPSDVLEKNNDNQKQLFIFDDVCGKFAFDQILGESWNLLSSRIREILKRKSTKLIFSCKSQIAKQKKFKTISLLSEKTCDIQSSECSHAIDDILQIAKNNLTESDIKCLKTSGSFKTSKCLPLLCNLFSALRRVETNFSNFFSNTKKSLEFELELMEKEPTWSTIFFLFVISNNKLEVCFITNNQSILTEIGESNISADKVLDVLESCSWLVNKTRETFFVCHDMVFDILVSFVSQRRLRDLLKFASADILSERCHLESIGVGPDIGCIKIPFDKEELYFKRLVLDVNNLEISIFSRNRQLKFKSYRKKFNKFLIKNAKDSNFIESIYKSDVSPLHLSTVQGLCDVVGVLLDISPPDIVNMTDQAGRTSLYIAAECNDIHTGTVLLKKMCDLNKSRTDECHEAESPLHVAAFKLYNGFIELLIKNNVAVNQLNAMQMTALHISCTMNDEKSVKFLLENGANPNICNTKMNTPLHTAADKGNNIIAKYLIDYKSNIDARNEDDESPLYLAALKGHCVIVDMLLKAKPKLANVNDETMSPLYVAAKGDFYETVKLLLDSGADPDSCSLLNKSALYAASENGHFKIVKYLLESKANPNVCTYGGFTPLYVTSLNEYTDIVHILLEYHADPNFSSSKNLSPLLEACLRGHVDIVKLLLEKDADVCYSDRNKRSPLYVASREGHIDIVKLLLERGANLNQATVVKRTPLFAATLEGHLEIVKYLLSKNADLNISTADGLTPLIVAKQEGHIDIVKIINLYLEQESCEI